MGCVYSYPLFSFQGSICFSAAKIILSNLHFLVKYYFSYLIQFCLLFFRQRMIFYQVSFSLSSTFFIYFSVLVFAVYVSGYQYIIRSPACQCFSFQTFAVDQCLYPFSDCFRAATFTYYTRLTENVNTFFTFFRYFFLPLKKGKRQPFFLGIKAAFLYLLLCYFSTASTSSAICSAVRWFSFITSSGLYLSRNSFFKPKFSTFTSESP